eukprot:jgi/Psemu1/284659/fgenesh1_pg.59_\
MSFAEETAGVSHHHDDDDDQRGWTVTQNDPERFPHVVLRGTAANLSALRGTDEQTRSIFFEERNIRNNNNNNTSQTGTGQPPLLLESPLAVSMAVTTAASALAATTVRSEDDDDDDPNDNTTEPSRPPPSAAMAIEGDVFVTPSQVLFVARDRDHAGDDLAVGAACIVLHALTEDPEPAVYLQLAGACDGDDDDAFAPFEVTLTPKSTTGDADADEHCRDLFDALCRLISLHPVDHDDDDDYYGGGGGGFFGGMGLQMGMEAGMGFGGGAIGGGFGDDWPLDYGESGECDFVWAPSLGGAGGGTATTTEEREAMLDHLDSLLVVAPGLERGEDDDDTMATGRKETRPGSIGVPD